MAIAGLVDLRCRLGVDDTVARLCELLEARGITVYARIDQGAEARRVGIAMPPMVLVLFGNPAQGLAFMLAHKSIAIDLPFKALIWESETNEAWLSYRSLDSIAQMHEIESLPFNGLIDLLAAAAA